MTASARLDPTVINELIDLGPETGLQLVKDLIELFSAEAPSRIAAMREGLAARDFKLIGQAAHAMRGGAGNLGAVGIGGLCTAIEAAAREEDAGEVAGLVDQVESELVLVHRALQERLVSLS